MHILSSKKSTTLTFVSRIPSWYCHTSCTIIQRFFLSHKLLGLSLETMTIWSD